eukprot:767076-Hanusia_phi.AAC.4
MSRLFSPCNPIPRRASARSDPNHRCKVSIPQQRRAPEREATCWFARRRSSSAETPTRSSDQHNLQRHLLHTYQDARIFVEFLRLDLNVFRLESEDDLKDYVKHCERISLLHSGVEENPNVKPARELFQTMQLQYTASHLVNKPRWVRNAEVETKLPASERGA